MSDISTDIPLRYGFGVHGGSVIAGDISFERLKVFTVLGDSVTVAARLQALTEQVGCAVLIPDGVDREAGGDPDASPWLDVSARGRTAPRQVRALRVLQPAEPSLSPA